MRKINKLFLTGSVLLLISLTFMAFIVYQNKNIFSRKFDPIKYRQLYDQSQWQQSQNFSESVELKKWATNKGYTGWDDYVDNNKDKVDVKKIKADIMSGLMKKGISDAQLYALAGYEYINGRDPTLLNPEHPPLGKYLIGLSISLFHNENVILLISGILILVLSFILTYIATRSFLASSIAFFLTSTNSLFIDQLVNGPQLDIFQLLFFLPLLLFIYLYTIRRRYWYIIGAGICFGLLISVKTFISYFFVFNCWLILYLFQHRKRLINKLIDFGIINIIGLFIFTISYFSFFTQGGNLRKFLGVQKYILDFYRQSQIDLLPFIGNYLRLIFTGSWKFWNPGNPVTRYDQWSFAWVIVFVAGLFVSYQLSVNKAKRGNPLILSLIAFLIVYNVFLLVFPVFPRYLLLLFVPMNILIPVYFFIPNKK